MQTSTNKKLLKIVYNNYSIFIITFLLFISIQNFAQINQKSSSYKPNIIFILSDDLGYADLGCYGQKIIKTPNIDKMAQEGMIFTQHYAGNTVCAPSRSSLLTGKHTGHTTIRGNVDVLTKSDELTTAKLLKKAGYVTACIGKWGIGHPPPPNDPKNNGFDYFFGVLSMWHAHNYYPEFIYKNGNKYPLNNIDKHVKKHYKAGQELLTGYATKRVDYTSDLYAKDALNWIEKQKQPFFLFLSLTTPHSNNEAMELGAKDGMEVPDYGIYKNKNWPSAEKGKAAMITRMDSDIGALLNKLKELGIDENTLVIFTSDNGPHMEGGVDAEFFNSNGSLTGTKRDLYEGGIRVPFIARWPGKIAQGAKSDHISAFWDFLATLADLTDQQIPDTLDGISYLPTLLGQEKQIEHKYLYWEFHEGSSKQAIRMGKWKAIRLSPSKPIELYDLDNDISERNNIALEHPEIIGKIKQILLNVRTNKKKWPLLDKQETMPF